MYIHVNRSAGIALQELYYSPQVQNFLNGTTSKELFANKAIYQPGNISARNFEEVRYTQCYV